MEHSSILDYLPGPIPYCCSGYASPHDGHDINPPCATVRAQNKFFQVLGEHNRRVIEAIREGVRL